ncbi:MAG TPA: hypothetical protein HPQ03_10135 [Deltaproteobacteria bacterium]|nr:hypothetical protein [Deltaproteobacteria bacterium]
MNPNLEILYTAVHRLGPLADAMVFLGGCATGLLLTDTAAAPVRATMDVDAIVEVASLPEYHKLAVKLRARGFVEDLSSEAPICRWKADNVILDVMPTDPEIMGFGNEWYAPAFAAAESVSLPSGKRIRMVPAPYFLATKLAAFDDRGGEDILLSRDMEDIVAVLDGRLEVVEEVNKSEKRLRIHLAQRFTILLQDQRFNDALPGYLPPDAASQNRLPALLERIRAISEF